MKRRVNVGWVLIAVLSETVLPAITLPRPETIDQARVLLGAPVERAINPWKTLAAAAFAAFAAVLMAGVMVLGPGVALENDQPVSLSRP